MGNCFCTKHFRYSSQKNLHKFITISNLTDGANILLINNNNHQHYYIWYDETEHITINSLLIFLKKYLDYPSYFKINNSYFGPHRYSINARNNMLIREYISTCKLYCNYKYHYKGVPYIPII